MDVKGRVSRRAAKFVGRAAVSLFQGLKDLETVTHRPSRVVGRQPRVPITGNEGSRDGHSPAVEGCWGTVPSPGCRPTARRACSPQ